MAYFPEKVFAFFLIAAAHHVKTVEAAVLTFIVY